MLLGIWGPFAIGKTTHLNAYMARCNGNLALKNVVFVFADLCLEYHMDRRGHYRDKQPVKGSQWSGTQESKMAPIRDMISDDNKTWVVESARYFSGMYEHLVEEHNACDGGLRFIIPVCDGPTMIKFMRARCASRNKEFREDYWVPNRAAYEADARYTNAARTWFEPNGIAYEIVRIDENREEFWRVNGVLDTWLSLQPDQWYGVAHKLKVFANVPEAIAEERAKRKGRY